jgi:RNA polymerase subunit RPABC4/transcription elongation factor Spt4
VARHATGALRVRLQTASTTDALLHCAGVGPQERASPKDHTERRAGPVDFQGILDAIGQFFENPIIVLGLRLAAVYIVVLWLASAFWAFRDMQLRTGNPVLPYLAAAMIILFSPVFFLLGVVIYRIVRPQERIGEVNERLLAEEAMLTEVEAVEACPTCRRRIDREWIICPTCRTRLKRVCPNCGKLVGLEWSLCAWCGRDFERREALQPVPSSLPLPATGTDTALPAASSSMAASQLDTPVARSSARQSIRSGVARGASRGASRATPSGGQAPPPDPLPEP